MKPKSSKQLFEEEKMHVEDIESNCSQKGIAKLCGTNDGLNSIKFHGFRTASNKIIKISGEALSKAERILAEELEVPAVAEKPVDSKHSALQTVIFDGEETLKGVEITLCTDRKNTLPGKCVPQTKSLENIKQPKNVNIKKSDSVPEHNNFISFSGIENFEGFKSASGKRIVISEKAIQKAQNILKEELEEVSIEDGGNPRKSLAKDKTLTNTTQPEYFQGFQSASGKNIQISDKALEKGRRILAEEMQDTSMHGVGYSEASKMPEIFKNSNSMHLNANSKQNLHDNMKIENFLGSQPVSDKNIKTSKKKLTLQRGLSEIRDDSLHELKKTKSNIFGRQEATTTSENLMQALRNTALCSVRHDINSVRTFVGFQAASGKNIKISDQAMKRAHDILADELKEIPVKSENILRPEVDICNLEFKKDFNAGQFSGFQSASGKNIEISEDAMKKGQALLADDFKEVSLKLESDLKSAPDISCEELKDNLNTGGFIGFKSASGKKLKISDEALQKASKILSEELQDVPLKVKHITQESNKIYNSKNLTSKVEFSSASGKFKTISENALKSGKNQINEVIVAFQDSNILREKNDSNKINHITRTSESKLPESAVRKSNSMLNRHGSGLTKSRLSLSRTKFKPPSVIENKFLTPVKLTLTQGSTSQTLNLEDFFNAVSTSTPNDKRNPIESETKGISLTQEITASTAAFLEDELKTSFVDDFKQIHWDSFDNPKTFEEKSSLQKNLNLRQIGIQLESNIPEFIKEARELNRRQQAQIIKKKACSEVLISPGLLFKSKSQANRLTWKQFVNDEKPKQYILNQLEDLGISKEIIEITFRNARDFKFDVTKFYSNVCENTEGILIGDGAKIILDSNNHIGVEEFKNAFLTISSVAPRLIHQNWISHHYQMIIFKLAMLEKLFPGEFSGQFFIPENVMLLLKYRYDREIDLAHRSALRKIVECDDIPSKRMVLSVLDIIKNDYDIELLLSDGWYSIMTSIDIGMQKFVESEKIRVGTKLMIQSAELRNCETGCSPLEIPNSVRLKIHTNSTRRCKWDIKLGYYRIPKPFLIKLDDVVENGGTITKLVLCVLRTYPLLYYDKGKKEDSISAFHSEKVEKRIQEENNTIEFENFELIFSQVRNEVENEDKLNRTQSSKSCKNIKNSATLLNLIQNGCEEETDLTATQQQDLQELYTRKIEEIQRRVAERLKLTATRNVTTLLKMRVIDANHPKQSAILSIWQPCDDICSVLQEGSIFEMINSNPSGIRCGELQLNSGNSTQFKLLRKNNFSIPESLIRQTVLIEDISKLDYKPMFNELDTFGLIVQVDNCIPKKFQSVFLVDLHQNILCIKFWAGLKEYAYDDIIKEQNFIFASNLQWRSNSSTYLIKCVFATDLSVFVEHPKSEDTRSKFNKFRNEFKNVNLPDFIKDCREKIDKSKNQLNKSATSATSFGRYDSLSALPYNSIESPNLNISNHKRRPTAQERIDRLLIYGAPPSISPLAYNKCRSSARKNYKSPVNFNKRLNENES